MGSFKNPIFYQKAYGLAHNIFKITKAFPANKKYSLTDQITRSSRTVCTNLAEAYRQKNKDHFLLKLTACEAENTETEVWIDFSKDCAYITNNIFEDLYSRNTEIREIIYYMINKPDKSR